MTIFNGIRPDMYLFGLWLSVSLTASAGNQNLKASFGSVALAGTGGQALSYWASANGCTSFNTGTGSITINGKTYSNISDLQLTDVLNLVKANSNGSGGAQWDPTAYSNFRSWLHAATTADMAYMLSAQLVVAELDVFNNFVKSGAYIDVAAVTGVSVSVLTNGVTIGSTTFKLAVDNAGFATVQSIMDAANAVLGSGTAADQTAANSATRTYENALQLILAAINNNQSLAVASY